MPESLKRNNGGRGIEPVGIGTRRGTALGPLVQRGHGNTSGFLLDIPTRARFGLYQKGIAERARDLPRVRSQTAELRVPKRQGTIPLALSRDGLPPPFCGLSPLLCVLFLVIVVVLGLVFLLVFVELGFWSFLGEFFFFSFEFEHAPSL